MPRLIANEQLTLGKRAALLLAGLLAAVAMYAGLAAGPISNASAEQTGFCANVTLQPLNQTYDRCYAWPWESGRLWKVGIITQSRAGCVTYAAVNTGDLQSSWECVGSYTTHEKWMSDDHQNHRGVIRNNNTQYSGTFSGFHACCFVD